MAHGLTIGQLAERVGTRAKTIRYYEHIGLLPKAPRDDSGYRVYPEGEVDRLKMILRSKSLGLSLKEIGEIIGYVADCHCDSVQIRLTVLIGKKIDEVDAKIAELARLKAGLLQFRNQLEHRIPRGPGREGRNSIADCTCISHREAEVQEQTSTRS